jgi:SsrA-binding protein
MLKNTTIENRSATYNFFLEEKFTTGIVLFGPEVKSIRNGDVSIKESFCYVKDGEIWIKNMYIKHYEHSRIEFDSKRDRKLLLKKKEIRKIESFLIDKGKTLIPVRIEVGKLIKVVISVAKGKRNYDKRNAIRERDLDRQNKFGE